MLKTLFWLLLLANLVLFGLNRGATEASGAGREPTRLANQIHPEWIHLRQEGMPTPAQPAEAAKTADTANPRGEGQAGQAATASVPPREPAPGSAPPPASSAPANPAPGAPVPPSSPAAPVPPPGSPGQQSQVAACLEAGEFGPADAARFETQLAPLALGNRVARQQVRSISSYIVFLPAQGSAEAAAAKAAELQALGITDYFVIRDGALQWGVSLGIFNNEAAARAHLAMLKQRGVQTARIAARRTAVNRFVFQIRDVDPDLRARIDSLKTAFPNQQFRACTPAEPDPLIVARKQG